MKSTRQLITVLFLAILAWSCEKEAKFNRIEGTLSAGLEINKSNIDSVPVVIIKVYDTLDFDTMTPNPEFFRESCMVMPDAKGYFHCDSLPDGNYFVTAGVGFKFADADYVKVTLSDGAAQAVNKTVNRVPLKNGPDNYSLFIESVSDFAVTRIEFFSGNTSLFSQDISLVIRTWDERYIYAYWGRYYTFLLDPDLNPTYELTLVREHLTFVTPKIPFFAYYNEYKIWENVPYFDMQITGNLCVAGRWGFSYAAYVFYDCDRSYTVN